MSTDLPEKKNSASVVASRSEGAEGGSAAIRLVEVHQIDEEIERRGFFFGIFQVGLNLKKGFTLKFERKPLKGGVKVRQVAE